MFLSSYSAARCIRALFCLVGLAAMAGCASTPREVGSAPIEVRLQSKTVAELPGLTPRLVFFNDKRTVLMLAPPENWGTPRMNTPELQEMLEHCDRAGQPLLQLQRVVLRDDKGSVLTTLENGGSQPLADLARHSSQTVATDYRPASAVLLLEVDPDHFHGQLREEIELVFRDAQGQVAPGVYARIESMTTTPQEVSLGQGRVTKANYLYVRLHNRSDDTYTLNGHDSGAMEASANRMLTASGMHGTIIAPGAAAIVRLPIELTESNVEPGVASQVELADYLAGWSGVVGPVVSAVIPLRVQIELKSDGRDGQMQRGVLTPSVQVQTTYHVERAGCFARGG